MPEADLERLRGELRALGSVAVAFSVGADSAFLAWVAHDTLGPDALAVTAMSPSLPASERVACAELAAEWGLRWQEVQTHELDEVRYRQNDTDRCYWCKDALMEAIEPIVEGTDTVVALGVNIDPPSAAGEGHSMCSPAWDARGERASHVEALREAHPA